MQMKSVITLLIAMFGVVVLASVLLFRQGEPVDVAPTNVAGAVRHVRGEGEVVIVEFSDFQCPACRTAQLVVERVLSEYPGQVRHVFRHFPLLSIHPYAEETARAAEAASLQDAFWEYHDLLFKRQDEWNGGEDLDARLTQYAQELGLDVARFRQDYESDVVARAVQEDLAFANQLRLRGTPSFFVNGKQVSAGELEAKVASIVSQ